MELVFYPNDILRQTTAPVTEFTAELKETLEEMVVIMDRGRGVGLAGPQVGLALSVFIVRLKEQKPVFFINPELTSTSHELSVYEEGCLSIPLVYAEIARPASISIQAYNLRGRPFRLDVEDFFARVVQHELDHLKGVLFTDHLSKPKRERLLDQYQKLRKM